MFIQFIVQFIGKSYPSGSGSPSMYDSGRSGLSAYDRSESGRSVERAYGRNRCKRES